MVELDKTALDRYLMCEGSFPEGDLLERPPHPGDRIGLEHHAATLGQHQNFPDHDGRKPQPIALVPSSAASIVAYGWANGNCAHSFPPGRVPLPGETLWIRIPADKLILIPT